MNDIQFYRMYLSVHLTKNFISFFFKNMTLLKIALSQCLRNIYEVQKFYLNRIKNFNLLFSMTSSYLK